MVAVKKEGWLPSFIPPKAFTLLEWMVVMAINLILLGLFMPHFGWMIRHSQSHQWCAQVSALLQQSSHMSDLGRRRLDLQVATNSLTLKDGEETLERLEFPSGWRLEPLPDLPHPTQSKNISQGLSSTHHPQIRFFDGAASSATLTLSKTPDQAVCAVISSSTGRVRVYIWDNLQSRWLDFF